MAKNLEEQVKNLPDSPGVYFFKNNGQILYVGKATSLRSRVRSYLREDLASTRSTWIASMMPLVNKVDFIQTDSVLEALILESQEIKKHQPPYNIREKDGKSFLHVGITDEDYPRVITFRGSMLREERNFRGFIPEGPYADENFALRYAFGPFPRGGELREALKIIRRIFPWRGDDCVPEGGRPCFNSQIGLCPGVCTGKISRQEYLRIIRNLVLFFQGKKSQLIKNLEREMKTEAKKLEFEKAEELKKKIFALQHIQDVSLIKKDKINEHSVSINFRIEAYDIAHISGTNTVGVMVVAQNGEIDKDSYRRFRIRGKSANKSDDTGNLLEVLERRLKHPEWPLPNVIVVDGSKAQSNTAEYALANHGLVIPVVSVIKDERHRARELRGPENIVESHRDLIIKLNHEAHRFAITYHRKLRGRIV